MLSTSTPYTMRKPFFIPFAKFVPHRVYTDTFEYQNYADKLLPQDKYGSLTSHISFKTIDRFDALEIEKGLLGYSIISYVVFIDGTNERVKIPIEHIKSWEGYKGVSDMEDEVLSSFKKWDKKTRHCSEPGCP